MNGLGVKRMHMAHAYAQFCHVRAGVFRTCSRTADHIVLVSTHTSRSTGHRHHPHRPHTLHAISRGSRVGTVTLSIPHCTLHLHSEHPLCPHRSHPRHTVRQRLRSMTLGTRSSTRLRPLPAFRLRPLPALGLRPLPAFRLRPFPAGRCSVPIALITVAIYVITVPFVVNTWSRLHPQPERPSRSAHSGQPVLHGGDHLSKSVP